MATRNKDQALVAHFARERETKNTIRFTEEVDEGSEPVIGTLYVQKVAVRDGLENPERLSVRIEKA